MKNQTVFGMLLDFKSNAANAFKKIKKHITDTSKLWGKLFGKMKDKAHDLAFSIGEVKNKFKMWVDEVKRRGPTITDVINDIGEKFGGVAGILADTLARPGAAMAAGASVAYQAGLSMESTLVHLQRQTDISAKEWDKYRDIIVGVSESLHAPMTQVQGLTKQFAEANIEVGDYSKLMETAISVNRATGVETQVVGHQISRLMRDLKFSGQDVQDYFNTLYGAAKVSPVTMAEMYGSADEMIAVVSKYMPDNMQKGLNDLTKIFASNADLFEGNMDLIHKMMRGAFNIQSPEFTQLRALAAAGGEGLAQSFQAAIESKDMSGAFKTLAEGARKLSFSNEDLQRIAGTGQQVFGLDPQTIRQLRQAKEEMFGMVDAASLAAKENNKILDETKNLVTVSERWHKVYSDIQRMLLPFGEVLIEFITPMLKFLGYAATKVAQLTTSLGGVGKWVMFIASALLTAKLWMAPFVTLAKVLLVNFLGIGTIVGKLASPLFKALGITGMLAGSTGKWLKGLFAVKAVAAATTGIYGETLVATTQTAAATGGLAKVLGNVKLLAGGVLQIFKRFAAPVLIILTILATIDRAFKESFNMGLVEMFAIAVSKIKDVLSGVFGFLAGIAQQLGSAGTAAALLLTILGFSTGAFSSIFAFSQGLVKSILGSVKMSSLLNLSFKKGSASVALTTVYTKVATAATAAWGFAVGAVGTAMKLVQAAIIGAKVLLVEFLLPLMLIVGAVILIDKLMKKAFGVGVVEVFTKAVNVVMSVIDAIVYGFSKIIDGIQWMRLNDEEYADYIRKKEDRNSRTTSLMDDVTNAMTPTVAGVDTSMSSADGSSALVPAGVDMSAFSPTGQTVSARESFGTDDIINALYDTNKRVVDVLNEMSKSPISNNNYADPSRHALINQRGGGQR